MVHRKDDQAAPLLARPTRGDQGQGVGIPASREADGDRGGGLSAQAPVQNSADAVL